MPNHSETSEATAVDLKLVGEHTWKEIQRLFVEWENAVRMADDLATERAQQDFELVARAYASLPADAAAVTTGRKAIVRSIISRLGGHGCADASAMLDAVITREEAAARRDAKRMG